MVHVFCHKDQWYIFDSGSASLHECDEKGALLLRERLGEKVDTSSVSEEERRAAAAAEREKMHAIKSPDIKAGSRPTFEPKKSDLYHAPKNLRAPKARDRRAD